MKENSKEAVMYEEAKRKLERVKIFYRHLRVYLVINIILFGLAISLYDQLGGQEVVDEGFQDWFILVGYAFFMGVGTNDTWVSSIQIPTFHQNQSYSRFY